MAEHTKIVAGNRCRIRAEHTDRIRNEINARYAERLARAGLYESIRLRSRIRPEIKRELERVAPGRGLYARTRRAWPRC